MPEASAATTIADGFTVVGFGTMGIGIAYAAARAGFSVTVIEPEEQHATRGRARLAEVASTAVARGEFDQPGASALLARVDLRTQWAGLPLEPMIAVEAVPESLELKRQVLAQMETFRPQLLATNTSGLSLKAMATGLADPERFIGLHFFNPVWARPLIEVIRTDATSDATHQLALDVVQRLGKSAVNARDVPGFATSRLGVLLGLEAIRMLADGVASAEDIDQAMVLGYGHPVGPLRLSDIVGLDVRLDIARYLAEHLGPRFEPPELLVDMVTRGHVGRKAGRGFYRWE